MLAVRILKEITDNLINAINNSSNDELIAKVILQNCVVMDHVNKFINVFQ